LRWFSWRYQEVNKNIWRYQEVNKNIVEEEAEILDALSE
jgi:hypothetical protein